MTTGQIIKFQAAAAVVLSIAPRGCCGILWVEITTGACFE